MTSAAYPAARRIASRIEAYFNRLISGPSTPASKSLRASVEGDLASLPEADVIEAVIDAAFWASLRREEGYVPRISMAILPPEAAKHPLVFERSLALDPASLARLGPAVERPGIHLGVWRNGESPAVWGTTRSIPPLSFVLEVIEPGLLVIKHPRADDAGKFVNVAVLEGDSVKLVDERAARMPDCPTVLSALLGYDASSSGADAMNIRVELALSMRAHRRGGLLLIVPSASDQWQESIVKRGSYVVAPPFSELASLVADDMRPRSESLSPAVEVIAGLTAVDGATVVTDEYQLLAFGAKIQRRRGWLPVDQVLVTEPVEGNVAAMVHPTELGGTRHLSAAQFAHDQRDALALVASQDGRFTIFAWSPTEEVVRAHRIETLLL